MLSAIGVLPKGERKRGSNIYSSGQPLIKVIYWRSMHAVAAAG